MKEFDYQIIDVIDASVYWKDINGKYLGCNKFMLNMAGMSREQIIGHTDFMLPWKEQASKIRAIDEYILKAGTQHRIEEMARTYDNKIMHFLSSKCPLYDENNNLIGIIGVSLDITDNRFLEKELTESEKILNEVISIKKRFLRNISHEARIPMGSILNTAEHLVENWQEINDAEKKSCMEIIYKESTRLSNFILNTFDTAKFNKNEIRLSLHKHNFNKMVKDIVSSFHSSYLNNEIDICLQASDEFTFVFDKELVKRAINNLLANAARYSKASQKKISVAIHKTTLKDTDMPAVLLSVTDEGIGIPEEELEAIFYSFTESTRSASKACGVGLGLTITKEIIELHSGNIWAENNPSKKGSSFYFTLPLTLFSTMNDGFSYNNSHIFSSSAPAKIIHKELSKLYPEEKQEFALIGISPANSYYTEKKISEILDWTSKHYNNFAIFIPDIVSSYTLEALGYKDGKLHQKIRKQDNYIINKVKNALLKYQEENKTYGVAKVHLLSELKHNECYKMLYEAYIKRFYTDKDFMQICLDSSKYVLESNTNFTKMHRSLPIDEYQQNIAAQYLLCELPALCYTTDLLNVENCDFIYHKLSNLIKQIYLDQEIVSHTQRFVVLS